MPKTVAPQTENEEQVDAAADDKIDTVDVTFDGQVYTIPADSLDWPVSVSLAFENGRTTTGIRDLLGPEQWAVFAAKKYRNRRFLEFFQLLGKAGGFRSTAF